MHRDPKATVLNFIDKVERILNSAGTSRECFNSILDPDADRINCYQNL